METLAIKALTGGGGSGGNLIDDTTTSTTKTWSSSKLNEDLATKAKQTELDNTNRRVDALFKIGEGQIYDVDTDVATCYSADVPTGAFCDNVLKIGGKSVVMNQLVDSSTTTVSLTNSHKYFTKISGTESIQTGSGNSVSVTGGTDMVIDLTQMFGSGNEPSTVAQFKAMFQKDYYAYNTGEIIHAPVKSVVVKDDDSVLTSTTNIPQAIQSLTGYGWSAGTAYNEVDYANKKYIQRVGRVDLGSLSYYRTLNADKYLFVGSSLQRKLNGGLLCKEYDKVTSDPAFMIDKTMWNSTNGYGQNTVVFRNDLYTSALDFKTGMNGVYLYYELATPIETDISSLLDEGFLEALDVEAGGTVTFVHDTDDNYRLPVPNTNEFLVALAEV